MQVISVDDIRRQVDAVDQAVARRAGQRDQLSKQLAETDAAIVAGRAELEAEEAVSDILTKASALSWGRTKGRLESLVERALKAVFTDRDYGFKIEQETKRGASSVSFTLVEGGIETDVWDDGGLGVADIVGFALRVAYLALRRPKLRQLLIYDEPFRFVSADYKPNLARFVKAVSQELGIQMVVITHDGAFSEQADQVIRLDKVDGKTVVCEQMA